MLQGHNNLCSVETRAGDVEGTYFVYVREQLAVLSVSENEVQSLGVLEGAEEFDKEWCYWVGI